MKQRKNDLIDPANEDFGLVMTCAIRYCLGRQTYVPGLVIGTIRPYISRISDRTLGCMIRDIERPDIFGGYGDPLIDKPGWLQFLNDLKKERDKRSKTRGTEAQGMTTYEMLKEFVKERNEALFSLDEQKIKKVMSKYGVEIPSDQEVFWLAVHKAICSTRDAPEDLKAQSAAWLYEHGSTPDLE